MQQALQVQIRVDQTLVTAIPELGPWLGHAVQVIALDLGRSEPAARPGRLSFEQFLATRLPWPADRPPLTLEDMEAAIAQGACDGENL